MAIIGTGQFAVKRIETAQPKVIVRPSADVIISGEAFSPATISAQRVLKVGDREEVLDNLLNLNSFSNNSFYEYFSYSQDLSNVAVTYNGNCEIEAWAFLDKNSNTIIDPASGSMFWYPVPRHIITCPKDTYRCKTYLHKGNVAIAEIKATVKGVEIEYAGRNIVMGASTGSFRPDHGQVLHFANNEYSWSNTSLAENFISSPLLTIPNLAGRKLHLSFYAKKTDNCRDMDCFIIQEDGYKVAWVTYNFKPSGYQQYKFSFTIPSTITKPCFIRFDNNRSVDGHQATVWVKDIMLSLNEAPYSPAPEDATLTLNDAPYTPNDELPASSADRFTFASDWNGQRDSRTVAVTPGASLDYLKEAISKGKIVHKGGLFLSNILAVRDINGSDDQASIRAGMSGLNNDGVAFFADPTNAYRKATDYLTGASHIKPQYMVDDRGSGTWGVMDVLPDRVVISNAARNQVILCNDINQIINEPQNISLSQSGVSSVGYIYLPMDYVTPGYPQRKIITLLDETVDVPMAYRFERVQPFVDLNVSVDCQKVSQGPSGLVEQRSTATIDMKIRTLIYNNDKIVAQTDWMTHTQHVEGQYRGQNNYQFLTDNVTAVNMRKGTLRTVVEGYYSVSLYAGTEIDDVGDKIPIGAYYSIFYGLEIEDMKFYNNRIIISSDGIYADLTDKPNEVSPGMMMRDKTGAVRINDTSFRPDIAGVVGGAEVTMSGVAMTAKKNFMGGTVTNEINRVSTGCYRINIPSGYSNSSYHVVVTPLATSPRIAVVNKSYSSFEIRIFPYNSSSPIDTSFSFIIFAV